MDFLIWIIKIKQALYLLAALVLFAPPLIDNTVTANRVLKAFSTELVMTNSLFIKIKLNLLILSKK